MKDCDASLSVRFRWLPVLCAVLVSLAVLVDVRGWAPFDPTAYAGMLVETDPSQFLVGWQFFRGEPWTMPPGAIRTLALPFGASVALTDSVPLLALPFKAIDPWLPRDFHYFGLFLVVSYALQAVFGVLLMRCATRNPALQFLGALFFVIQRLFIARHPGALAANWLLLWALWIHVREGPRHEADIRRVLCEWGVLILLAAWVHVYLCVMVSGFFVAYLMRLCVQHPRLAPASALLWAASLAALCFFSFYLEGFFEHGFSALDKGATARGLDLYVFARWSDHALGAGLVLLLAVGLLRFLRNAPLEPLRVHAPLIALLASFFLISLGNVIRLKGQVWFSFSATLFHDVFPGSMRFFWPVYYSVLYFALSQVARLSIRTWVLVGVFIAALGLQVQNVEKRLGRRAHYESSAGHSFWKERNAWVELFSHFDAAYSYPPFHEVVASRHGWRHRDLQHFAYLAGQEGLLFHGGRMARRPATAGAERELRASLASGELDPGGLVVMGYRNLPRFHPRGTPEMVFSDRDGYVLAHSNRSVYRPDTILEHHPYPDLATWQEAAEGSTLVVGYSDGRDSSRQDGVAEYLGTIGSEALLPEAPAAYFAVLRGGRIVHEVWGPAAGFASEFGPYGMRVEKGVQVVWVGEVGVNLYPEGLSLVEIDPAQRILRNASVGHRRGEYRRVANPERMP